MLRPAQHDAFGRRPDDVVERDRLVRLGNVFYHLQTEHPVVPRQPVLRQRQVDVTYDTGRRFLREWRPVVRVVSQHLLITAVSSRETNWKKPALTRVQKRTPVMFFLCLVTLTL